jgi:hypothetical protein
MIVDNIWNLTDEVHLTLRVETYSPHTLGYVRDWNTYR